VAARPVILVHGWTSSAGQLADTRTQLSSRLGGGYTVLRFDYGPVSTHWAAQPEIAGCLADYVATASAAFARSGGDGKVVVVAHSMGGLAIRFATDTRYSGRDIGPLLAGVLTVDTPHLGSPWGGTLAAQVKEMAAHLVDAIHASGHRRPAVSAGVRARRRRYLCQVAGQHQVEAWVNALYGVGACPAAPRSSPAGQTGA
jgi:pimeloyl-ACP methyl ester carboxylesterase